MLIVLRRVKQPVLLAMAVAACARQPETIRIDGSAGVAPLVRALATDYRTRETRTTIDIGTDLGAVARLQAVAEGRIDIAMASHGIDHDAIRQAGMAVHEIAQTPVVFAVNSSVPIERFTRQQLCDLFGGRVANWRQLGGPDLPVAVKMRPRDEVDAEIAIAAIDCLGNIPAPSARVQVIERADSLAASLAATRGSVGLTSGTYVDQSNGQMKAVALDGVAPTADNVASKQYALVRRSYLVTKAQPTPAVERFLGFVRDTGGARVIRANGALPASL